MNILVDPFIPKLYDWLSSWWMAPGCCRHFGVTLQDTGPDVDGHEVLVIDDERGAPKVDQVVIPVGDGHAVGAPVGRAVEDERLGERETSAEV